MSPSTVSVILLHHNQYVHTAACLQSLRRCSYQDLEIIVVDLGSTDGSADRLNITFPEITLLTVDRKTGTTAANNAGMRAANGEHILLLNNASVVHPGFIEPLIAALANEPVAGAASPLIRFYSAPTFVHYAGGPERIDLIRGRNTWRGWKTTLPLPSNEIETTTAVHSAAVMVKRSAIRQIGMMDERLMHGYEEFDWSLRLKHAGYALLFVPQSQVLVKETPVREKRLRAKLMTRNRLWLSRRYLPFHLHFLTIVYAWCISLPFHLFRYLIDTSSTHLGAIIAGSFEGTFTSSSLSR